MCECVERERKNYWMKNPPQSCFLLATCRFAFTPLIPSLPFLIISIFLLLLSEFQSHTHKHDPSHDVRYLQFFFWSFFFLHFSFSDLQIYQIFAVYIIIYLFFSCRWHTVRTRVNCLRPLTTQCPLGVNVASPLFQCLVVGKPVIWTIKSN